VAWAVFEAAGWRVDTYNGRTCLCWTVRTDDKTYTRRRFLDGDDPRFINEPGFVSGWYGLDRALSIRNGRTLVYVNGEPSVIVAQHFGVPAVTISGGGER
jgi:hypothetical protein